MKKILAIFSFVLVFILVTTGCSNDNSAQVRMSSQKLSSGLDQIISLTNKLDNIDTNKMDLNSILSNEGSIVSSTTQTSAFNFDQSTPKNALDERPFLFAPLYDENSQDRTPIDFSYMQKFNECANIAPNSPSMQFNVPSPQKFRQQCINFNAKRAMKMNNDIKPCSVSTYSQNEYSSLATLSNDCKNLNQEFVTAKANVLKSCSEAKANLKKLKESKKSIPENDLRTLTSYYEVVKDCINNVKSCKSCSSNLKNINRKKNNLSTNSGTINSELLQVYNKLDANCCTLNNTIYCVNEINCFAKKLNGEKCSTNMSVNPYIRNNRYLSSLNSAKNKEFYNSQSKNQTNQPYNNQLKATDQNKSNITNSPINNQTNTQNQSQNDIKRSLEPNFDTKSVTNNITPTNNYTKSNETTKYKEQNGQNYVNSPKNNTIYNQTDTLNRPNTNNNSAKNELIFTQKDYSNNVTTNKLQKNDENEKKVTENKQNELATNSDRNNFIKNAQKTDVNEQNKAIFNTNRYKNDEKTTKNDNISSKSTGSYNNITNNIQKQKNEKIANNFYYSSNNNSLNNANSNTNPYTKDIKDKDKYLSNLRNYNSNNENEKTNYKRNNNTNAYDSTLHNQTNDLSRNQKINSTNFNNNVAKGSTFNQSSSKYVETNKNQNTTNNSSNLNQISSTTFNTTYTPNMTPTPTYNNGVNNNSNYGYTTYPNLDRTHPVEIERQNEDKYATNQDDTNNDPNTLEKNKDYTSKIEPNKTQQNDVKPSSLSQYSNDNKAFTYYKNNSENNINNNHYQTPQYQYENAKNDNVTRQNQNNSGTQYHNARNFARNYDPTKNYRSSTNLLVKPQSVRANVS